MPIQVFLEARICYPFSELTFFRRKQSTSRDHPPLFAFGILCPSCARSQRPRLIKGIPVARRKPCLTSFVEVRSSHPKLESVPIPRSNGGFPNAEALKADVLIRGPQSSTIFFIKIQAVCFRYYDLQQSSALGTFLCLLADVLIFPENIIATPSSGSRPLCCAHRVNILHYLPFLFIFLYPR
jgi:hypothetical protein